MSLRAISIPGSYVYTLYSAPSGGKVVGLPTKGGSSSGMKYYVSLIHSVMPAPSGKCEVTDHFYRYGGCHRVRVICS